MKLKQCVTWIRNLNPIAWYRICNYDFLNTKSIRFEPDIEESFSIAITWFSYSADYEILISSIKSVNHTLYSKEKSVEIFIIEDISSPFSDSQKNELQSLSSFDITFMPSRHPLKWAGLSTIFSEFEAYKKIFHTSNTRWIMKLDSDALLLSDSFLAALKSRNINSTPVYIGQSAKKLYKYNTTTQSCDWAQGGSYIFNFSALKTMSESSFSKCAFETIKFTKELPIKYIPEDVFFSNLFKQSGNEITYLPLHFPIWFRNDLNLPECNELSCYSVLHFEGCKNKQVSTWNDFLKERPQFISTLDWLFSKTH